MASKGQKFNKYTEELKLEIVNKYLNNQGSSRSLAKEYGISYKSNIVDKYNRLFLNIKYVISIVHFWFGLSALKFLLSILG